MRGIKKAVEAILDGMALGEKVREEERNLADTNNETFLTFLEDDKPLILPEPRSPPITGSFSLKVDSNQAPNPMSKASKPRAKALIPPLSDKETCAMTGFSKSCFHYMNGVVPSHWHIHKILDVLQFGDYLGPSKGQKPQTYKAALALSKSAHWIKAIQSKYNSLIENETWNLTELPSD